MFSYVFCDGMKLIQDAIRLRPSLAWPVCCCHRGALACTPLGETFQHQQGCRTTNREDGFEAFKLPQLHYIWCGGRGGSKNYQEIKKGAQLILLLRTVVHYIIISPLKLISQPPF